MVQRAPAPRDEGQAVDIRGAAIDVARRAGIPGALRQARTRTRGMTYASATGKHLADMNAAFGAADVEIVRGDLADSLHEACSDRIFGCRLDLGLWRRHDRHACLSPWLTGCW